ncbi:MAG: O-acetyl-ADP-ribose deacetylase [Bacteroidetes bacterium]|nr:O-acetyl-ADP-ribose deacetylase [Bacteroidota bacterium]
MIDKRIEIIQGDITLLQTDAIVNAANSTLLGGGGVDGAIHRAAGSELLIECKTLNGCLTGEAKITGGYNLPARHVVHTVGPIWSGGNKNEDILLKNCYNNSMLIAAAHGLKSIAFPSISTGVYGFPFERACRIALITVGEYLKLEPQFEKVIFCAFSKSDYEKFLSIFQELNSVK